MDRYGCDVLLSNLNVQFDDLFDGTPKNRLFRLDSCVYFWFWKFRKFVIKQIQCSQSRCKWKWKVIILDTIQWNVHFISTNSLIFSFVWIWFRVFGIAELCKNDNITFSIENSVQTSNRSFREKKTFSSFFFLNS